MKVQRAVLESELYTGLLIRYFSNNEGRYVEEIRNEMLNNRLAAEKKVKSKVGIRKLLLNLEKNGYLKKINGDKTNHKLGKNIKVFYLIWEKIVEDFINFMIEYKLKKDEEKIGSLTKYSETKDYYRLNKNMKEYCQNKLIQDLFTFIFRCINKNFTDIKELKCYYIDFLELEVFKINDDKNSSFYAQIIDQSGIKGLKEAYLSDDNKKSNFFNLIEEKYGRKRMFEFKQFFTFLDLIPSFTERKIRMTGDIIMPTSYEFSRKYLEGIELDEYRG